MNESWQRFLVRYPENNCKAIVEGHVFYFLVQHITNARHQLLRVYCDTSQMFRSCALISVALQGLLRELYKSQGHSSSGTTEWDWSIYEAHLEPGGAENNAAVTSMNPDCREHPTTTVKGGEIAQVPALWQTRPVDAKAARTNVRATQLVTSTRTQSEMMLRRIFIFSHFVARFC